ncbi:MAG: hypothetical protein WCY49_07395 [Anaerovoracaceae bacterium]
MAKLYKFYSTKQEIIDAIRQTLKDTPDHNTYFDGVQFTDDDIKVAIEDGEMFAADRCPANVVLTWKSIPKMMLRNLVELELYRGYMKKTLRNDPGMAIKGTTANPQWAKYEHIVNLLEKHVLTELKEYIMVLNYSQFY